MPHSLPLGSLPTELSDKLQHYYNEMKERLALAHYEPTELNGGKFCEIVFRILEWHTSGSFLPLGTPISNFQQAIKKFENQSSFPDSIRFHIPHALNLIFPIRNKRGVAHAANEVDPNHMDATLVTACADWVMAELVRIFHSVSTSEAQAIVEGLVSKQVPVLWRFGEHERVISPEKRKFTKSDKVLIHLYAAHPNEITCNNLFTWIEYDPKNKPRFRNELLKQLHNDDLIHFDSIRDIARISPKGIRWVEKNIQLTFD